MTSGHTEHTADPERGHSIFSGGEAWSETLGGPSYPNSGVGTKDPSSEGPFHAGPHKARRDFDDGANALWSLYGKAAKAHDEAHIQSLAEDMDGILVFAGLFSAILTAFLVQNIQTLQFDPPKQLVYYQQQAVYYQQYSAYYQEQSFAMLDQISRQIASVAVQASVPSLAPRVSTPPTVTGSSLPYTTHRVSLPSISPPSNPTFKPAISDIRVNTCWLVALVCSLSAALLAILVQQWVRSYMQIFQQYDHPLKRARFRQFFFEGTTKMRKLAEAVPMLICLSLLLFFIGLGDSMLNTDTFVGITTTTLIGICGSFYPYSVWVHLKNLQSPYRTLISRPIFFLMQKFPRTYFRGRKPHKTMTMEAYQEELVMEETKRKERDVRATRWLVDNTTVNAEMEPLVLAIPGTFNTEWGREVWIDVASRGPFSRLREGTAVDTIGGGVRYLFETCKNHSYFQNEEARHRRMRACVEAAASLVCCIDFRLDRFGDIGKLISEIGDIEKINQSLTTTSDPSFVIRWTCLSLVAIQQTLSGNQLKMLAGYAVSGLARFKSEYGEPDEAAWKNARRIEQCLKTAWQRVEDLRREFEPWAQKKTKEEVEEILRKHEPQISELEREADGIEDVDWRISLYQKEMDKATNRLIRQLPGVSFDEPRQSEALLIGENVFSPATSSAPVTPLLVFPGRQVQVFARFSLKLHEALNGQVADGYESVLESLKSVDHVLVPLCLSDGLMRRQLWRLQDLRDGGGLGFTIELFFLSLRQLLSIPSLHESSNVFYIGTFKIITSRWEEGKDSPGTQQILLNIICDLIIPGRGVFSDFLYPEHITTMLFHSVGNMLQGYEDPHEHICDAVQEIESVDPRSCMDIELRRQALAVISHSCGSTISSADSVS